jgi:hypothetical protein
MYNNSPYKKNIEVLNFRILLTLIIDEVRFLADELHFQFFFPTKFPCLSDALIVIKIYFLTFLKT